jgi:metal-dependent hydrolase (beta-lactamase superfamily II)
MTPDTISSKINRVLTIKKHTEYQIIVSGCRRDKIEATRVRDRGELIVEGRSYAVPGGFHRGA